MVDAKRMPSLWDNIVVDGLGKESCVEGTTSGSKNCSVEHSAVKVVLESVSSIRTIETAFGSVSAESAVSCPSVGPRFGDVQPNGGS